MASNKIMNHLSSSLKKGSRYDGRKFDEYRPIKIDYGVSQTAEGSARVTLGDTVVLAGVKLELGVPYPDTPDKGGIMVNAELIPMASPEFESGPPSIESIELSRVIDRGIRESGAIDLKKLCIKKGESCWTVIIDLIPLNDDGNLFDACSLAALAALKDAKIPKLEDGAVNYKEKTNEGLPIDKLPIGVTVIKIGDDFLVDPLRVEYENLAARLTVASMADGNLCALQKGGNEPLSIDDIKTMVDLAIKKGKELRKHIK